MNHYLKFEIGGIEFAVPIEEVKEITRPKVIQKKEKVPKNIFGFFEFRKEKIALYDLPKFFKIEPDDSFEVIIYEVNRKQFGFKIDKVLGVIAVEDLAPFPKLIKSKDYFTGIIKQGNSLIQVISFKKFLSGVRFKTIEKYL